MSTKEHAHPRNNLGRQLVPLEVVNQTGRDDLYVYLVGTTNPGSPQGNWYHLDDFEGNLRKCTPTERETTYSLPVPRPVQTIMLPQLSGMRAYFSFDAPLEVTVPRNGIPTAPSGWSPSSNFDKLFDWVELTWEIGATSSTLGGNTTQVDMFGLPFELSLTGLDADGKGQTLTSGFEAGGARQRILRAIHDAGAPWDRLVVRDRASGSDLRALAPYHGMELGTFPKDQLDDYIDRVWALYGANTLRASVEGTAYDGGVVGSELVFTPEGGRGEWIAFPKPSTFTVYTSGPLPTVASPAAGVLAAALQAGFLRSTLLRSADLPCCDAAQFYQDPPVNAYAKVLHAFAGRGGAYAFGFDDVCSKSSFIAVHEPRSARITLRAF